MSLPRPSPRVAAFQSLLTPRAATRVETPTLLRIARYWRDAAQGRAMPARRDIDPASLRGLLPFVFLVDVERPPLQFRYRLIGTAIGSFTGRDLTGRDIDEGTYGPYASLVHAFFAIVAEERVPALARGRAIFNPAHDWQRIELLALPMSSDGATVTQILGGYTTVNDPEHRDAAREPAMEFLSVTPDPILFDPP